MSIYSGFATRSQQQAYDGLVADLINVLQRRVIKFYLDQHTDEKKFHEVLLQLQEYLAKMEKNKYMEPKLSQTLNPLLQITSSVSSSFEPAELKAEAQKVIACERESQSLSFQRHTVPNLSSDLPFGKIKRQFALKDGSWLGGGVQNPECNQKVDSKEDLFPYTPANYRRRKWFERELREQKGRRPVSRNNLQYVVREYISRTKTRKMISRKDGSP